MKKATNLATLTFLVFTAIIGLSITQRSLSATIETSIDSEMGCRLRLSGEIEIGDAETLESQIKSMLKRIPERGTFYDTAGEYPDFAVCLDSIGGSLKEGVRIAKVLYRNQISSAVPAGATCVSACAIAFMGGARDASSDDEFSTAPHRLLHPKGILGFHAPALNVSQRDFNAEELNEAFKLALDGIEAVLRLATDQLIEFPPSLLVSMLETPPTDMFYINTVYRANRWKIIVSPAAYPTNSAFSALTHSCVNADTFGTEIDVERIEEWLNWTFEQFEHQSRANVTAEALSDKHIDGDSILKSYAVGNFLLNVLPMWSFTDAPPGPCVITSDLSRAFRGEGHELTIHPFQFYSPITEIADIDSNNKRFAKELAALSTKMYQNNLSTSNTNCWLTTTIGRITNVNEYVNLRRRPRLAEPSLRRIPFGEQVRFQDIDNLTVVGDESDRQSCISACRTSVYKDDEGAARRRAQQCIDDNMLWYEITDAHGNRGWISRKFLAEIDVPDFKKPDWCDKAKSDLEIRICSRSDLSDLDILLNRIYSEKKALKGTRAAVIERMKKRSSCNLNDECLRKVYLETLEFLESL